VRYLFDDLRLGDRHTGSGIGPGTTNNYGGTGNAALSGNFNTTGIPSPLADTVGQEILQDYPLPNTGGWSGKPAMLRVVDFCTTTTR